MARIFRRSRLFAGFGTAEYWVRDLGVELVVEFVYGQRLVGLFQLEQYFVAG
jgi:hypothetical protein